MPDQTSPSLIRAVGRWQIVGLSLNDVIGSGIYLLPAAAAALLGPASLWAVLLAGLAVALIVLCFAEASSYFDQPGSAYLYARTAFGEFVGFEVGWMTWLARVASAATLAAGFAQALSYAWPATESGLPRVLAIVLPLLGLMVVNIAGVRWGVNVAVVLVVSKLIPLVLFAVAGVFVARWSTVAAQPAGSGDLGQAALLLLFAYSGFENTPAAAGEYKNPQRDVPFALLVNITVVTTLYFAVQWVALGTLPLVGESPTPLADAARGFLGGWAGWLLTIGGAVSILGTNGNTVFAGPRYLFAMARDGFGPAFLGRVHPRFRTPAWAVVLTVAIALPLALSGTFAKLAMLSVMARLFTYLGTVAAVPVLRRKLQPGAGGVRLPGGPAIPIAAGILSLAFAASATSGQLLAAAGALAVGVVIFLLRSDRRFKPDSTSEQ
jgi:amino acid transporter